MEKELIKPQRPEHFVRDYIVIFAIAFVCFGVGLYLDFRFSFLILIVIIVGVPAWRFRKYNAQMIAYTQANNINKFEQGLPSSDVDVNANIKRYQAEQKLKRQTASWWQLWRY
jgi:hypothetical protein